MKITRKLRHSGGYTILEIIVALALTGVIAATGFEFYISMHNQTMAQEEIADMQQNSRATLDDMVRTLRMAGYKIGSHTPYEIIGDSLKVYFSDTQPVDTVMYYIANSYGVYYQGEGDEASKCLMKKQNSLQPVVYSEMIEDISYTVINSSTIEVSVEVRTSKADHSREENGGYRTLTMTETVSLRNANI